MESGGDDKFMASLYESAPHDMAVVQDPEILSIIMVGYRFTIQQGHKAFVVDSHQVVHDWSHRVDASDVPIHAIHGATDPVVSIGSVEAFYQARHNRARLTRLDDAGQLIFYKHPDVVLDAMEEMLTRQEQS